MHTISPVQKSNENWKIPVWNWIIQWWTLNKHIWLALVKQIYGIFSHSFRFFLFCWSIESEKFSERIKASERKNQQRKALVKPYNNKNTCHWRNEKKSRIEKWCLNSSIHLSKALTHCVFCFEMCQWFCDQHRTTSTNNYCDGVSSVCNNHQVPMIHHFEFLSSIQFRTHPNRFL